MSRLTSAPVLVFASVAAAAALLPGCAAHSDTRPAAAQDAHSLSAPDQRAYRQYLAEQNLPYQDFSLVGGQQQNAFWEWRHQHPDAGGT